MRLAVVSDIHGNLPALHAVVADAGRVDGWLNLGDTLAGPLWPAETADYLMQRGWPTIAGNHERQMLSLEPWRLSAADRYAAERITTHQRAWLAALPDTLSAAHGLRCVHGTAASDIECLLETVTPNGMRAATQDEVQARLAPEPAATLVLCGHTHVPRLLRVGSAQVLNPGSVGLQAYDHDQPYPHVVENGTPQASYAVIEHDGKAWTVNLRRVDYDFEKAARQAESVGRGDWADALRTGRVGRREAELQILP
jgi:predicted phosphodiesterase